MFQQYTALAGILLHMCSLSLVTLAWMHKPSSLRPIRRISATAIPQEDERIHRKIILSSGREAKLLSRNVPITSTLSITVYEWEDPAEVVESYWEAQQQNDIFVRDSRLLDPFGIVSWPGSVVAAQEMYRHQATAVKNQRVLLFGAGVGVEAQAAAILGANFVMATDIHPTTLRQLEFGASQQPNIPEGVINTQILDLFAHENEQPIPSTYDLLVVADVLYNEQLANQVCRRIAEALAKNKKMRVLVTDSQRFVPSFTSELEKCLKEKQVVVSSPIEWQETTLQKFTGSGVCINEDQTYDVTVRTLWIGL